MTASMASPGPSLPLVEVYGILPSPSAEEISLEEGHIRIGDKLYSFVVIPSSFESHAISNAKMVAYAAILGIILLITGGLFFARIGAIAQLGDTTHKALSWASTVIGGGFLLAVVSYSLQNICIKKLPSYSRRREASRAFNAEYRRLLKEKYNVTDIRPELLEKTSQGSNSFVWTTLDDQGDICHLQYQNIIIPNLPKESLSLFKSAIEHPNTLWEKGISVFENEQAEYRPVSLGNLPLRTVKADSLVRTSKSGELCHFFIKLPNGDEITLSCNGQTSVTDLRAEVGKRMNTAPQKINLFYDGKILLDGMILFDACPNFRKNHTTIYARLGSPKPLMR